MFLAQQVIDESFLSLDFLVRPRIFHGFAYFILFPLLFHFPTRFILGVNVRSHQPDLLQSRYQGRHPNPNRILLQCDPE